MQGQVDHGKNFGFCSKFYEEPLKTFGERFYIFKGLLWLLCEKKKKGNRSGVVEKKPNLMMDQGKKVSHELLS